MNIPPPSYVAQVWAASDDTITVFFPSEAGRGHTVQLSNDLYGMQCLMQILRERKNEDRCTTIMQPGCPNQWEIERARKKIKLSIGSEARLTPEAVKALREDAPRQRRIEAKAFQRLQEAKQAEAVLEELGL